MADRANDPGLFEGTAEYYARFRGSYPSAFINLVAHCCRLDRNGRLLDLGCGPGLLAIPFARWAREVVGLDPEPEMLSAAAASAKEAEVFNIRFVRGSSRELGPHLGHFRLVTIGRAFHWMDRAATLASLHDLVIPGGAVAIIGEERDQDPKSWRSIIREVTDRRGDPKNEGTLEHERPGYVSHDQILARSAFRGPDYLRWPSARSWTVEEIIGYIRSTSTGALRKRAGTTEAFEAEARRALAEAEPSGRFIERYRFSAKIGWRD
ncbi:MAG: class I SAM-dependent methyltransferase [Proteobacteria bacterium]|nr:class I SAM-dependent methyltransferase [Pseudomonadota bacterium]MBI3495814.1 class I SAM-dependent methyltransferase [Pseudomonadota bacterium]